MRPKRLIPLLLLLLGVSVNAVAGTLARSDLEVINVWNDSDRIDMVRTFQPSIYNIGTTTNAVPTPIPAWVRKTAKEIADPNPAAFAKRNGLKPHASLHMFHRQPNYPDEAMKIGIDGKPYGWSIYVPGVRTDPAQNLRMSYAQEAFRKAVLENVRSGINQGVSIFEFQDASRDYYADFSNKAVEGFRNMLQRDPRMAKHRSGLQKMNIQPASFNIRDYVASVTSGDQITRQRQFLWDRPSELRDSWLAFCRFQMADFLTSVVRDGRDYAQTRGRDVTFLHHFYFLTELDLRVVDSFDGIWAEMPLKHYASSAVPARMPSLPVREYYPPSGVMGAAAAVLDGINDNSPVMWLPWGVPFPELAYKKGSCANLYKVWLSEIYASSGTALLAYAFPAAEFTQRPELVESIRALDPAFFEPQRKLTQAWKTPREVGSFTQFLKNHKELFDGTTPVADVLLLKTIDAYSLGTKVGENIFGWAELLGDAHILFRTMLDGNGIDKKIRLSADRLASFSKVIALGPCRSYAETQVSALGKWLATPGRLLLVEDDENTWKKRLPAIPANSIVRSANLGADYQKGRPQAPVQQASQLLSGALDTNLDNRSLVRITTKNQAGPQVWLVHLVNRNYSWHDDRIEARKDVRIRLSRSKLGLPSQLLAETFDANGGRLQPATCTVRQDSVEISLPELKLYTIIRLRASGS